jgi:hypothetical protein
MGDTSHLQAVKLNLLESNANFNSTSSILDPESYQKQMHETKYDEFTNMTGLIEEDIHPVAPSSSIFCLSLNIKLRNEIQDPQHLPHIVIQLKACLALVKG